MYCECGCGGKTRIAHRTDPKLRWVKGIPLRFINGHNITVPANIRVLHFWKKVSVFTGSDCIEWQERCNYKGYGETRLVPNCNFAHRAAYTLTYGPVPKHLDIDHLCRNRKCVNPDHMELVPRRVNVQRGLSAKLNPALVSQIRNSQESAYSIAKRLGISHSAVSAARLGKTWKG